MFSHIGNHYFRDCVHVIVPAFMKLDIQLVGTKQKFMVSLDLSIWNEEISLSIKLSRLTKFVFWMVRIQKHARPSEIRTHSEFELLLYLFASLFLWDRNSSYHNWVRYQDCRASINAGMIFTRLYNGWKISSCRLSWQRFTKTWSNSSIIIQWAFEYRTSPVFQMVQTCLVVKWSGFQMVGSTDIRKPDIFVRFLNGLVHKHQRTFKNRTFFPDFEWFWSTDINNHSKTGHFCPVFKWSTM